MRREVVVLTAVVAMTAACGRMPAHPTAALRADDLSRLAASPAVSAPTDSASPIQEPVATPPVSAAAPTNPPSAARPATEPPAPTLKVCIGSGEPWRFGATGTSVAGQVRVTWSLPGGCPIWTGVLTSTYGLSVQVSGPAGQYLDQPPATACKTGVTYSLLVKNPPADFPPMKLTTAPSC